MPGELGAGHVDGVCRPRENKYLFRGRQGVGGAHPLRHKMVFLQAKRGNKEGNITRLSVSSQGIHTDPQRALHKLGVPLSVVSIHRVGASSSPRAVTSALPFQRSSSVHLSNPRRRSIPQTPLWLRISVKQKGQSRESDLLSERGCGSISRF